MAVSLQRLILFLCMLLVALPAWAGLPVYYTQVSASDVSSTVTVSLGVTADRAFTVTVANDGTKVIYVNTNGAPATASNLKILAGEIHKFSTNGSYPITVLSIICGAGETSTVRVFAFPTK